jgi:pimeloyl-[acyl-carrier protein] synthase
MAAGVNLLDPAVLADPYPTLHRLRREAPVHWDETHGVWMLSRYRDALAALRDVRVYSSEIHGGERTALDTTNWFVFHDAPRHARLRGLVTEAFTPSVVERLRPRVAALVNGLLDRIDDAGGGDLLADLGFPLPAMVIAELLGVPSDALDDFKRWSADLAALGSTVKQAADRVERVRRAQASAAALNAYFADVVRRRGSRSAEGDDLIARLTLARAEGDRLDERELVETCTFLLFTGHETTTNLIGNGMLALLRHPDALRAVAAAPGAIAPAVEELLRFDSPVQVRVRVLREDVSIDAERLRAGQRVWILLGAANRDPERFAEPDRLLPARTDNRHLAFGYGAHFCVGAALARLEGAMAIGALLARFPRIRLAADAVRWRPNTTMRGLEALPIDVR